MSEKSILTTRAAEYVTLFSGTVAHSCYEQVALMKADLQILVFVEARKSSEIVCKMIRQKLTKLVYQFCLFWSSILRKGFAEFFLKLQNCLPDNYGILCTSFTHKKVITVHDSRILIVQKRIELVEKVDSYRAGYTQEERISLEKVLTIFLQR